jgi:dipeptidyl aminopeptidase/acylaminoacyl peptidase
MLPLRSFLSAFRYAWLLPALFFSLPGHGQVPPDKLTVEKIMRDPKWIGTSPSSPYWSPDGKYLYFYWNPEGAISDSLYYITRGDLDPKKAGYDAQVSSSARSRAAYNGARTAYTYSKEGDIFLVDVKSGKERRITHTIDMETAPVFSFHDTRIVWSRNSNLFSWDPATGQTDQLTNFQHTPAPPKEEKKEPANAQEKWLQQDQLRQFDVLRSRKAKKDLADSIDKLHPNEEPKAIYIEDKMLNNVRISPDGRFITWRLIRRPAGAKTTIVPSYVTETGFTQDIPGRTKVGAPQGSYSFFIFDREKDTVIQLPTENIPGIRDLPDYVKDYARNKTDTSAAIGESSNRDAGNAKGASSESSKGGASGKSKQPALRGVIVNGPSWSPGGDHAVVDIRSQDNKDRWLMLLDAATGQLKLLDRQRDEAWIGGPGIGYAPEGFAEGWIDDNTFWFQSEASGYSHLYKVNVHTGEKTALTGGHSNGHYEVLQASLSLDKKTFYIITNEVHPGEQQFYQLPVTGGKAERVTTLTGANQVIISPDERQLAILYSYTNKPWELYIQENKPGAHPQQVTNRAMSAAFRAYPWRDPAIITFTARDGATVYARLYRPANAVAAAAFNTPSGPDPSASSTTPNPSTSAAPSGPGTGIPATTSDPGPSASATAAATAGGNPAVIFVHGAGYLQNAHKWWSSYFREYMFNNLLADNGYTVLDIDYRGSAGYGRDWRTGIYRHMGGKDLSDQVDGVKYLADHEGIDPRRVGIYGGSYGGFITLMAMFTEPDVFAAGAGLRCVTDWAHYNHGYTSDILNEPYDDSLAYRRSSPIYFAEGLKGHLLMCHGMVDENVHFQDIVRLTQRLIELGKNNWELAVYPVEDHGFVEPSSWTDEYKRIFRLFQTYLAP